jgi:hypothetical protein
MTGLPQNFDALLVLLAPVVCRSIEDQTLHLSPLEQDVQRSLHRQRDLLQKSEVIVESIS